MNEENNNIKNKQPKEDLENRNKEKTIKKDSIENLKNKIKSLKFKNLSLLADMENLRKKTEQEKIEIGKYASISLLRNIMPTLDMFGNALKTKEVSEEIKNWLLGFKMIDSNLKEILKSHGVKEIKPEVNDFFDPNFHQVLEQIENDEVEEGRILEIKENGYLLHDRLLKPVFVTVAKKSKNKKEKIIN